VSDTILYQAAKEALERWSQEMPQPEDYAVLVAIQAADRAQHLALLHRMWFYDPLNVDVVHPDIVERTDEGRQRLDDVLKIAKEARAEAKQAMDAAKYAQSMALDRRRAELAEAEAAVTMERDESDSFARTARENVKRSYRTTHRELRDIREQVRETVAEIDQRETEVAD
jgi:hypothetical protein